MAKIPQIPDVLTIYTRNTKLLPGINNVIINDEKNR